MSELTRKLTDRRDAAAACGRHAEAAELNNAAARLAGIADEERATLDRLDFAPGVDVLEKDWEAHRGTIGEK